MSRATPTVGGARRKTSSAQSLKRKIRFRCGLPANSAVMEVLKRRPGWTEVDDEDDSWDLNWCDVCHLKMVFSSPQLSNLADSPKYKSLQARQRIPHFRNHYELTRKNLLARNLKRLRKSLLKDGQTQDAELCDSMPLCFEIPSEYMMFVEEYRKTPGLTWIVKPASGSQGRGIFLFKKLRDLASIKNLRDETQGDMASDMGTSYVVQRYIELPYLIAERKFDLRIYVLVTSFSPLKIWLAREGFARLTGSNYSLSTIKDTKIHLTNVSIQRSHSCNASSQRSPTNVSKTNTDSSVDEKQSDEKAENLKGKTCKPRGLKWSLHQLRQFLIATHGNEVVEILLQRITRLIILSLKAVQQVIIQDLHCFELYGYDILLESSLRPWLLEVNASPAMTPTDKDDYLLKYNLISDVLNILDYEGKLTGNERRVGGFDLIWNDGPMHILPPGSDCCSICIAPAMVPTWISQTEKILTPRLNSFLGCRNDRSDQLQCLEDSIEKWKAANTK